MQRIYTAANLPEAQLLLDRLAEHGIRARIFNANASSLAGELPIDASLPQIWVEDREQAVRGRAVIEEFMHAQHLGSPWRCPRCGEENPSSFETCWACAAARPG